MDNKIDYYLKMTEKGRLYSIRKDGELIGFITYYVCNGDINRYINKEPYEILDDNINGDIIYIEHLIGTNNKTYAKDSLHIWNTFKKYLKNQFPHIHRIRWVDGRKNESINRYGGKI